VELAVIFLAKQYYDLVPQYDLKVIYFAFICFAE